MKKAPQPNTPHTPRQTRRDSGAELSASELSDDFSVPRSSLTATIHQRVGPFESVPRRTDSHVLVNAPVSFTLHV